jgi:hypothetical protein
MKTINRTVIAIIPKQPYNEWANSFEEQLESWMAAPDDWPPKRTYKMFKDWFEVIFVQI